MNFDPVAAVDFAYRSPTSRPFPAFPHRRCAATMPRAGATARLQWQKEGVDNDA